jgi:hypothetical protein
MLLPLLIGSATVFISMAIQIAAVVIMLRYLFDLISTSQADYGSKAFNTYVVSIVMLMLFVGHLVQVGIWAVLFVYLGEFSDFATAFYHSMVNFASLGYGDIVMSERWRLLGAIEACNGVLMFGLSAGTMLSVMTFLLSNFSSLKENFESLKHDK